MYNYVELLMARKSSGARFNLGEPWAGELADFCEAHYGAPEVRIIREALAFFISTQLTAEPETKRRFLEARKKRLENSGNKVAVAPKKSFGEPRS